MEQIENFSPQLYFEPKQSLEQKYNSYLSHIFNWTQFRNQKPKERHVLDLEPMAQLCEFFGNPQKGKFKIVHVAGTNGKGSVSIKTAKALQSLGFKVGMFISPHISCFRERYQINGEIIPMDKAVETMERVFQVIKEQDFDVRFFEIITIIGLLEFERH